MRKALLIAAITVAGVNSAHAADDYVWQYSDSGKTVELTNLIPDSDAIDLILSCDKGKKMGSFSKVETTEKLVDKKKATLVFHASGQEFKLKGKLTPNEEAGTPGFDTDVDWSSPFWGALSKSPELTIDMGKESQTYSLKGADITKFIKACTK